MRIRSESALTLRDRLSRLRFPAACKLLGPEGARLIRAGGKFPIDVGVAVELGDDVLRVHVNGAAVTVRLAAEAPKRLAWKCSRCRSACEHVGAAFGLVLEEKTALGLAAPPDEDTPLELLDEEQLLARALAERDSRAAGEKMAVKAVDPKVLWTDYLVTSALSGKTYRVALRGWERGESYCSCPDYRKNTLGTCKHILKVQRLARRRFSEGTRRRPFRQRELAVHVVYGEELELRLLVPEKLDGAVAAVVAPLASRVIEDVQDLVARIGKLAAMEVPVTVYPDAEELIERRLFRARLAARAAEIRKDPKRHPLRKNLLKVELLPYQLDGIAFAAGAGRAVLADDMGLGKTIQAIGLAELLARDAGIQKTLVVCPASLKAQWRSEIERFSGRSVQLVLGSAEERAGQYQNSSFFTICNYEQALRDILSVERSRWDLIVLDEGQRIKNWESQTSRVLKGLRSPFALVLSGTPLENRLEELYSVVEFIDERRLGPSFRFFHKHRVVDENGKVLGYKQLDELRARLAPILLRRTRRSVLAELPPRSTEIVRIAPTDEQLGLHNANLSIVSTIVKKRFISEMDLLRLQKALLMCRLAANSTLLVDKQPPGYSSKLEHLDGLLESLAQDLGRKTVLFSEWTGMLDLIEPLLEKHRIGFVRLDGAVPQRLRQRLVHNFQNDPRTGFFISTNAGATGLNLQAANTVVNVDLPWNPAILEQRIARAHRMGQKRPVQVFLLVTTETLEEKLLATLAAKHELALAALDSKSSIDEVSLTSGIDELKRRLEVLLGASAPAPIDESQRAERRTEAAGLDRREKLAASGGQLLSAAFAFLGELAGNAVENEALRRTSAMVERSLEECLETDAQGRMKLSFTLPDRAAFAGLAQAMARIIGAQAAGQA